MRKILLCLILFMPTFASAEGVVANYVESPKAVGTARLSVLFWDVYDATLYAPKGEYAKGESFALKLNYLMEFKGDEIAERSVEEMRKQGFADEMKLAAWYSQMKAIFPNVTKGSVITGIYQPNKPTPFYAGSTKLGVIQDPEFGRHFFDIWLSEKSSEPEMRRTLLGV
jgi:hypothetical protein